ncbi:MAG: hypothetical protein U9P38_08510, partial [Campylobacterota bacterium]|nr:hypothetical protein [Campylobacterota bacterium]
ISAQEGTRDRKVIDNKIEVSKYYADLGKGTDYLLENITEDPITVEIAKGEIYALDQEEEHYPEATHHLTINEDHIGIKGDMGGYDVIEGRVVNGNMETLQDIDGIDGGQGRDILRATVTNGSSASIQNVEEIELRFAGDDDAILDLVNATGVEKVSVLISTAEGTVDNVRSIEKFAVAQTQQDITFDNGSAGTLYLDTSFVGHPANTVTIDFAKNPTQNAIIKSIYSTFEYDQSDSGSTLASAGIDVTGANTIALTAGKDTIQKIVVSNSGSINLAPWVGDPPMPLMFKALQELSTDAITGDVKVYIDNEDGASIGYIHTAAGAEEIYIQTGEHRLLNNLTINLEGGDDMLIIKGDHASVIPQSARIDGDGGAMNKLVVNSDIATTLEDGVQEEAFDDFLIFIIMDILDGTVDMTKMDDMQMVVLGDTFEDGSAFKGLEANAYITFTTDVDDDGEDTTIKLSGYTIEDNPMDTYYINMMGAGADIDYGDVIMDYIETLNFIANDGGKMKMVVQSANAATVINASGNSYLDIGDKAISSVAKLTAGDSGIDANIAGATVDQVVVTGAGWDIIALGDTSNGDGAKNTAEVGRGNDTLTGGKGVDVVNMDSGNDEYKGSDGADIITLGPGRDSYNPQRVTNSQGTEVDIIHDFISGEDIFDFRKVVRDADNEEDGGKYIGEANGYGAVLSSLSEEETGAEAVLDRDNFVLYVDVNDDADITDADMTIDLSANEVKDLSAYDFIFE